MTNTTRKSVENLDAETFKNKNKDKLSDYFIQKYLLIKTSIEEFMVEAKINETAQQISYCIRSNPILLSICLAIIAAFVVPLLIFASFATACVAFAFTGFLLVEVAIFAVAAGIFCFTLFNLISTCSVIVIFVVFAWLSICYMAKSVITIKNKTFPRAKVQ